MDLLSRSRELDWYHTIELAPGQTTDGMFDLRPYVERYGLPERMDGLRALDVGTFDGFWAFEMERRGATVTALDIDDEVQQDWPPRRRPAEYNKRGEGFRIAHELLESNVERVSMNVYELSPERLGSFDFVFCGSLLIHLRDQLLALERIASVSAGRALIAEEYDKLLSLLPVAVARYRPGAKGAVVFWRPNPKLWAQMIRTAGFDRVERHDRFALESPRGFSTPHVVFHCGESVVAPS